jgi:predicted secreted protein with PEFG-CTERM motif
MQIIPIFDSEIRVRGENTSLVEYGNVEVSTVDNSITIQVNTTKIQNGSILEEYQIPKHVIDAPGGQIDVKENGNDIDCTQTESDVERILDCPMQYGTKELTLTGTVVIPEFGTTAALILTLSIVTVITVFSRNRLLRNFR